MIVYTCEDTFEAMMTCIYDAWASKEGHQNIRLKTEPLGTMELFCEYRTVTSDPVKTRKVVRSIQQKISSTAYLMVYRCALSDHPDKLDRIYRFLLLGFAYPAQLTDMLQHPYVNAVFELNRKVMNEAHLFRECVRFQALPDGVLLAHIKPKSDILTLLYPAFDDRMPSENGSAMLKIRWIHLQICGSLFSIRLRLHNATTQTANVLICQSGTVNI